MVGGKEVIRDRLVVKSSQMRVARRPYLILQLVRRGFYGWGQLSPFKTPLMDGWGSAIWNLVGENEVLGCGWFATFRVQRVDLKVVYDDELPWIGGGGGGGGGGVDGHFTSICSYWMWTCSK